jgi:hypothetical protein
MSKKKDTAIGDAVQRDRSKGGMRNIPTKGDGVGGNLMQLSGLVDELRSLVEERFLGANQYEAIEGAQEIFQRTIDLFSAIHKVDEEESHDALNQFLGQLIKVMRDSQLTRVRVEELDRRLNDLAVERLRESSVEIVKSGAAEFMDALVEHLGYYHREFISLVEKYGEACQTFEKEKRAIEETVAVIETEAQKAAEDRGEDNLRAAFFFASSRQVAFVKKLEELKDKRATEESKEELKKLRQHILRDKNWVKALRDKVEAMKKRISDHEKNIGLAERSSSGEIKRQIIFIKSEIEVIRNTFKMVGKEELFWGCAFGLHEVVDFTPVNMLVYRIELGDRSLFGFNFDEYLSKESKLNQDYEECLQLPCGHEVELAPVSPLANGAECSFDNDDEEDEVDQPETEAATTELLGKRDEELADLCLCVLWGLVADFIRKAQLANKQLIRGGDFGRMPRKVAKLLCLVGAISKDEKEKITKQLPKIMEGRGLVRIQLRKTIGKQYKTGESCSVEKPWLFLTDVGRERGHELLLQSSRQELVARVIQENIKVEERYLERHLGLPSPRLRQAGIKAK